MRDELEDVVHLYIIAAAVQELDGAQWSVSIVASGFEVRAVFELLGFRDVEKVLADGVLAVDLVLGEAEVGDVEEAYLLSSLFHRISSYQANYG